MTRCGNCPVSDPSLPCRAGVYCDWMAAEPPDPVHVRHINAVSLCDAKRPLPPQAARPCVEATTNRHAARDALVRSCDYRLDAAGLERGEGCGCSPATRCLLRRGKWPDDPSAVDYGDCLACVS